MGGLFVVYKTLIICGIRTLEIGNEKGTAGTDDELVLLSVRVKK